jgi:hypothetical protein
VESKISLMGQNDAGAAGEWTVTLALGLWLIAALLIMSVRLIVDAIKIRD